MNSVSAQCGHVKRRLVRRERLTGKVLDFALSAIDEKRGGGPDDGSLLRMRTKLLLGHQLDDLELNIMLDVLLLHKRLAVPDSDDLRELRELFAKARSRTTA